MKRWLLQLGFTLGLLLTLTAGTMWVRGVWATDIGRFYVARTEAGVLTEDLVTATTNGRWVSLKLYRLRRRIVSDGEATEVRLEHETTRGEPPRLLGDPSEGTISNRLGFKVGAGQRRWPANEPVWVDSSTKFVAAPGWLPLLGLAMLTTAFGAVLRRMRRQRLRAAQGFCPICGYDLRGAAHERCPECGQTVAAASHGEPSCLSKMK